MRPGVWLGLGLVVLAALLDLQVVLRADPGPVSAEVMAQAVRVLKEQQQPGDLVVHSPLFGVSELAALGELAARPDLPVLAVRSGRRVLLLDRIDQPMFGFGVESKTVELPAPLVLRIFEPTGDAAAPVYELLSSLDPSVMKVERPEGTVSAVCNRVRAEGGFDCPGEAEWLYAAPRTLHIGGVDRECVWAHPTTGGVIVFVLPAPNPPAAGRHLELSVEAGMTDDAVTGTADGAPVGIDIRQNQQPKGRLAVPNQVGFRTGKFRVDAAQPVELRITTARDGRRHHCLNATITEVPRAVKGWLLKFGGPVLVLFYLVLQLAALPQAALTDDDDFYIPAGISYAEWLGKVVRFDGAFQRESIDRAFEPNHEHPPLAKYVFGLCHFAFRGWLGPTDSARVGTVLFSTLLAAAMLWLARRHLGAERGLYAGGLAVLLLLLLPRFFFHSHAATLDVPVATMYFLAAAAVMEAERRPRAAWVAGVLFGLASATKLNGPFLLLPYGLFLILTRWGLGKGEPRDPRTFNLPRIPITLVTMATVGPLVFLGLWPWLWFDLFQRVGAYVGFHLHHYGILFLYFGTVYSKDPHAPWHAPFTMAATTTPLAITALALVGLGFGAAVVARRLRHKDGPDDDQRKEGDLVLSSALHAAFAILIVAFSGGAKYGGEKLFAPFFPFWCLLAGYGALRLGEAVVTPRARAVVGGVVAFAVASALALQLHFGPYALSAYNGLVSGLRGATAVGFERQYYDLAFRDLVGWLSANAPPNTKVHFLPNNWEYVRTYNWYRKAGELRPDIQVVNSEREANFLVITHERRFARYGADLQRYRGRKVILEKRVDGVPIWTLLDLR